MPRNRTYSDGTPFGTPGAGHRAFVAGNAARMRNDEAKGRALRKNWNVFAGALKDHGLIIPRNDGDWNALALSVGVPSAEIEAGIGVEKIKSAAWLYMDIKSGIMAR
jgi:hypothetical protein